jgi:hypothetical protein
MELAKGVLQNAAGKNIIIDTFFSIGEDDVDAEDVQMINDLEEYIYYEYYLENGDSYSHLIKRGNTTYGSDGWIVFSHFLSSSGWYHYVYYYSIR